MTTEEYRLKLARATELAMLDPHEGSEDGNELQGLVDAVQEYEREHFPDMFMRELITDMRGGVPERCSFCQQRSANLEPWEGSTWACFACVDHEYAEARAANKNNTADDQ